MNDMRFGLPAPALGGGLGLSDESKLALSLWSSDVEGLTLRSRDQGAEDVVWFGDEGGEREEEPLLFGLCCGAESLKMWTVSVADDTHNKVDAALKLML
jgi:hypothetical protein